MKKGKIEVVGFKDSRSYRYNLTRLTRGCSLFDGRETSEECVRTVKWRWLVKVLKS